MQSLVARFWLPWVVTSGLTTHDGDVAFLVQPADSDSGICRHDIFGIFMRNWDESEEKGNQNCSVEEDLRDAQHICKHLNIPLHEADFIDQYWNRVFSDFVAQYSRGLTPNPDLECNRSIKFDALLEYARGLGAESVATGHYARLVRSEDGNFPFLAVLVLYACCYLARMTTVICQPQSL